MEINYYKITTPGLFFANIQRALNLGGDFVYVFNQTLNSQDILVKNNRRFKIKNLKPMYDLDGKQSYLKFPHQDRFYLWLAQIQEIH